MVSIDPNKIVTYLIGIVVVFLLLAELMPEAESAGDTLNASGVPLGALFASGGVLFLVIMAGVLIVMVRGAMAKK